MPAETAMCGVLLGFTPAQGRAQGPAFAALSPLNEQKNSHLAVAV